MSTEAMRMVNTNSLGTYQSLLCRPSTFLPLRQWMLAPLRHLVDPGEYLAILPLFSLTTMSMSCGAVYRRSRQNKLTLFTCIVGSAPPWHPPPSTSSPQVARVVGMSSNAASHQTLQVVIVHFTSLSNFKLVKDAIQTVLTPSSGSSLRVPEVIVIPKPAGPRRFLTALHTAVTRPVVDPFFMPTATSPMSPGLHAINPFFSLTGAARSPGGRSTASARTVSDRSTKSPKDFMDAAHPHAAPPSPLGQSDNMEYFSDAAAILNSSPATGVLLQSPDGQPAGIFFHPRPRSGNPPSSPGLERDRIYETRHRPFARMPSGGDVTSPPVARPSARPINSDPSDIVVSSRQKTRASSLSLAEDSPQPSIEQNLDSVGISSGDSNSPQRFLTRRQSQQSVHNATSPPPSPQMQAAGRAGNTRRGSRRPTVEAHALAPTGIPTSKKGRLGRTAISYHL
ncbi:hypothetical protein BC629DRAFT_1599887 [Irpex lacteus]|nr:hypothetical protein BC629DRAFT_1599887 [Irpex lacteus]